MSKNLWTKFYQENKERLQKKHVKYIIIFINNKNKKKRQYGHKICKNLSEDEKQKLVEYIKNIIEWKKNALL